MSFSVTNEERGVGKRMHASDTSIVHDSSDHTIIVNDIQGEATSYIRLHISACQQPIDPDIPVSCVTLEAEDILIRRSHEFDRSK